MSFDPRAPRRRTGIALAGAALILGGAALAALAGRGPVARLAGPATPTAALPAAATSAPARPTATVAAVAPAVVPVDTPADTPAPVLPLAGGAAGTVALARPIRYAALGASDTVGVGTLDPAHQNWTAQVNAQLPAGTVYQPFARSGITLHEALTYEVPAAVRFQPTLVTVWLVVNDALRGVPLSLYKQELQTLLDQVTGQTQATVLLLNAPDIGNLLPPTVGPGTRAQVRAVAAEWNQAIAAVAAPYGPRVRIVDLFAASAQESHHPDWISADGFHPSAAGYAQIAGQVVATLHRSGLLP